MTRRRKITAAAVGGAVVIAAGISAGLFATSSNGPSSASLSPGQSWSSAYQAASPGDVIQLAPGTYSGQTILDAGKTGTPVTFQGGPGVVMNGDLTLGTTSACNGSDHLIFKDFKINGAFVTRCGSTDLAFEDITARSMHLGGGDGLTVIQSIIGPTIDEVSEIKNGARNVLIESSIFHDSLVSDPANHSECIQIWGAGVLNVLIHNTIFRNCTDFDVLVKASDSSAISFKDSFLDNPMPGNEATTLCNPNCPRGGSAVRYSTYAYPNSFFTNNMNNGGLSIDIAGKVTVSGNYKGTLPLVPPGPTPPPTTTTTTTTPTTTTSTTTTTQPTTTTTSTTTTTTTQPTTTTTQPPPPNPRLTLFCSAFVTEMQKSSPYATWKNNNPGEYGRWATYRDGICANSNPAVPSMTTYFGRALIDAGKMVG